MRIKPRIIHFGQWHIVITQDDSRDKYFRFSLGNDYRDDFYSFYLNYKELNKFTNTLFELIEEVDESRKREKIPSKTGKTSATI